MMLVSPRVDLVLLTVRGGRLAVLLVKGSVQPSRSGWGLPGGRISSDEDLDKAAHRRLRDATGLDIEPWHVEQLKTYLSDGADPRALSVVYIAFLPIGTDPAPGSEAEAFRWWAVDDLWDEGPTLVSGHDLVIGDAVERCRSKLEYTTVAASFLSEPFTLGELRRIYENVWGVKLHHSNFARKLTSSPGYLVAERDGSPGRATLYRRGPAEFVMPPIPRPTPEAIDDIREQIGQLH